MLNSNAFGEARRDPHGRASSLGVWSNAKSAARLRRYRDFRDRRCHSDPGGS